MPTVTRASGLTITAPDTYRIEGDDRSGAGADRIRKGPRRARPAAPPSTGTPDADALLEALDRQDVDLVDRVDLQPASEAPPHSAAHRAAARPPEARTRAEVELAIAPDEDAVLLVAQNGAYSWVLPSAAVPSPPPGRRTRRDGPPRKVVRFEIDVTVPRSRPAPTRRGPVADVMTGRITVYALTFAAKVAVGSGARFLERHVRRGLVVVKGPEPSGWTLTRPGDITLPADRAARILLFVHGTFSSTVGSFGALGATPWGRAFLSAAAAEYDAILGFDHTTLSDDPMENAAELLRAIEGLAAPLPPRLDVVAFSRGGLVVRAIVEHLLPLTPGICRIERGVFVACTNGGTPLANPEHWLTLADMYTNAAVGAFRLLMLLPQATASALILQEMVAGVGALVKHLATAAASDVPGLTAMQPEGAFVTTLNARQPGQPEPGAIAYFAVTAEFKPDLAGETHLPRELPRGLLVSLTDGLVDRIMGEANDLIVGTASMTAIDEAIGTYVRDTLAFGVTPQVYHTSYFTRPELANALTRWLELPAPSQSATLRPIPAPRDLVLPAAVDTDVVVADAAAPARDAAALIASESPSFVIVRRRHGDEWLHYAFLAEEVLSPARARPDDALIDALNLHEWQRSPEDQAEAAGAFAATTLGPPTLRRRVVMIGGEPVGVVPEPGLGARMDIVELARDAAHPDSTTARIASRRSMPTFSTHPARHPSPSGAEAAAAPPVPRMVEASPAPAPEPPRSAGPLRRSIRRSARPAGGEPPVRAEPPVAVAPGAPAGIAAGKIECHLLAEMDPEVILEATATIEVSLSREMLTPLSGRASATSGPVLVDATGKLLVQVMPRVNFAVAPGTVDRIAVDPPAEGSPLLLYFDVTAKHPGAGEVWIIVRQHQMGVARLVLKPAVVTQPSATPPRRAVAEGDAIAAPPLARPLDQLSIFEQKIGTTVQYLFELEMPSLNEFGLHASPPLDVPRDAYVARLYKEIEDRYVSTYDHAAQAADVAAFTAELQAYGAVLFDRLFPREIQDLLWKHRDAIRSVRVVSTEPFIPWEIVHLREPGGAIEPDAPTRFLGQMGLVRWLHNVNGLPPATLRIREGKARYVIPDYVDPELQLPSTLNERLYLEQTFAAVPIEPQPNPLRAALTAPGTFDLLHFACHGEADSSAISQARIVLAGRDEGELVRTYMNASTVETFARLRGADGVQPIVFLNACQAGRAGYQLTGIGGFAQAFLKAGAGAFVGTLWSVDDQPAFFFGKAFYDALRAGKSIAEAAIAAREAARAEDATWLAYVVYAHPHATLA